MSLIYWKSGNSSMFPRESLPVKETRQGYFFFLNLTKIEFIFWNTLVIEIGDIAVQFYPLTVKCVKILLFATKLFTLSSSNGAAFRQPLLSLCLELLFDVFLFDWLNFLVSPTNMYIAFVSGEMEEAFG